MQFKKILFFIISTMILLIGCNSKSENNKESKEIVEKNNTKFSLTTIDSKFLNIDLKENSIQVDEIKDKVILLNFFATWCPPCKAEIPHLINLKDKYENKFEIISVSVGNRDAKLSDNSTLIEFANDNKINYIITNSQNNFKMADILGGVKTIPTMFLFDLEGKLIQKYVGVVPQEMLETDILKALGE